MLLLATRLGDITVEDILGMGFPILIGLGIVAAIFYAVIVSKQNAINDAQPIQVATATVIDKQQVSPNAIAIDVWLLFETNDGRRVRLVCSAKNEIVVGDKGQMRWQGTRLISFTRNGDSAKASSNGQNIQMVLSGEWKCVCGRVNQSYVSTCACGVSKHEVV